MGFDSRFRLFSDAAIETDKTEDWLVASVITGFNQSLPKQNQLPATTFPIHTFRPNKIDCIK